MACVTCTLNNAEAFLPAPFPTRAPERFYVANLGVAKAYRRQGIARLILRQCERLGERGTADCCMCAYGAEVAASTDHVAFIQLVPSLPSCCQVRSLAMLCLQRACMTLAV